jgi:N-acetylneuraminic acid mutarotase
VAELNDLWRFSKGQWTWMGGPDESWSEVDQLGIYGTQGTAAPGNLPGSRDSGMSWTDAEGNLWLFGGEGFSSVYTATSPYMNDLWKYSNGQWTWMDGSNVGGRTGTYGTLGTPAAGNNPGGRVGAATWIDASGNLWLFGGLGGDSAGNLGDLNDLWEYQP